MKLDTNSMYYALQFLFAVSISTYPMLFSKFDNFNLQRRILPKFQELAHDYKALVHDLNKLRKNVYGSLFWDKFKKSGIIGMVEYMFQIFTNMLFRVVHEDHDSSLGCGQPYVL